MEFFGRILTGWDIQQNRWGWNRLWCLEMDCLLSESSFTCFTDKIQNNLVKPVKPLGIKGLFLTLISKNSHCRCFKEGESEVQNDNTAWIDMSFLYGSTTNQLIKVMNTTGMKSWQTFIPFWLWVPRKQYVKKCPTLFEYFKNVNKTVI